MKDCSKKAARRAFHAPMTQWGKDREATFRASQIRGEDSWKQQDWETTCCRRVLVDSIGGAKGGGQLFWNTANIEEIIIMSQHKQCIQIVPSVLFLHYTTACTPSHSTCEVGCGSHIARNYLPPVPGMELTPGIRLAISPNRTVKW